MQCVQTKVTACTATSHSRNTVTRMRLGWFGYVGRGGNIALSEVAREVGSSFRSKGQHS